MNLSLNILMTGSRLQLSDIEENRRALKTWWSSHPLFATGCIGPKIHFAAWTGNVDAVRMEIQSGVNVNLVHRGATPLILAVWNMHKNVVELLLSHEKCTAAPIILDVWDRKPETPLHFAAWNNDVYAIEALVNAGANVLVRDRPGNSPLDEAVCNGNIAATKALIKAGADVWPQNEPESPAICCAVESGDINLMKILVEALADLSTVYNHFGGTILHWAARGGHVNLMKVLIEAGADVSS